MPRSTVVVNPLQPTLRCPCSDFPGGRGCPYPCFPLPSHEGNGAPGEAPERLRGVPNGRLTDARRAPRQRPVTRVCRFGARWSTDGGPRASPALHRVRVVGAPIPLRHPDAAIDGALDQRGTQKISADSRAGISFFEMFGQFGLEACTHEFVAFANSDRKSASTLCHEQTHELRQNAFSFDHLVCA